jgi:UDP:flavonoid glycosyltransferase YjiC (YdhE family)
MRRRRCIGLEFQTGEYVGGTVGAASGATSFMQTGGERWTEVAASAALYAIRPEAMRILFTTFPAYGHFHPLAPLALAARDAGHDVRVASGPDLASWAKSCGLAAYSVGPGHTDIQLAAQSRYPDDTWTAHMFTDVWVPAALPGLLGLSDAWRPEMIVHEEQEYAGLLLAAIVGIPCVTHSWHAPVRPAAGRRRMQELLVQIWTEHLPGRPARTSGETYLDACPAPLQSDEIAEIEGVVPVRPVPFDGPPVDGPAWLDDLPRPAAYVTLGTVPVFSTVERLQLIVDAVAPLVAAVVVTTGPNPVEALGDTVPNVWATTYLPQSLLLDRVDLVVSQGGAGGTLGALLHGLPHLVLPQGGQSQISAARSIQQIGAGLSLGPAAQNKTSIRAAAMALLEEPAYKANATRVGLELQGRASPADVIAILVRSHGSSSAQSQFHAD